MKQKVISLLITVVIMAAVFFIIRHLQSGKTQTPADTEKGPWEKYTEFMHETKILPGVEFQVKGNTLICSDPRRDRIMHTLEISEKQ